MELQMSLVQTALTTAVNDLILMSSGYSFWVLQSLLLSYWLSMSRLPRLCIPQEGHEVFRVLCPQTHLAADSTTELSHRFLHADPAQPLPFPKQPRSG